MADKKHNIETEDELLRKREFFKLKAELAGHDKDIASAQGSMNALYERGKIFKISKSMLKFAKELEAKDINDVIADLTEKLQVAHWMGHKMGRQFQMFDEDRTPQTEIAYQEGNVVGLEGRTMTNPYNPGSEEFQEWQKGVNDGNEIRNREFADAMERAQQASEEEEDEDDVDDEEENEDDE